MLELPVGRDPTPAPWHPWNAQSFMRSLEKCWRRTLGMNFRGFGVRGCKKAGLEGGNLSGCEPDAAGGYRLRCSTHPTVDGKGDPILWDAPFSIN